MKRILVTGGLGYLGGRITQHLLENQFAVAVTSRHPDVRPSWLPSSTEILPLALESKIVLPQNGFDTIIHLAGLNEIDSQRDEIAALAVNGEGTLRLLRWAHQNKVQRFLYLSTAHVYGSPLKGCITEESATRPIHPYAVSHRIAEDYVYASFRRGEMDAVILRLSNGIGAPRNFEVNRWSLIGNDLCKQAVIDRRLTLRSSGASQRNFICLNDVTRSVVHLLGLKTLGGEIYNLGGETAHSVIDIAHRVARSCQTLLGYLPPIAINSGAQIETAYPLDYRIDKLRLTGFEHSGQIDREIEETLKLVSEHSRNLPDSQLP